MVWIMIMISHCIIFLKCTVLQRKLIFTLNLYFFSLKGFKKYNQEGTMFKYKNLGMILKDMGVLINRQTTSISQ